MLQGSFYDIVQSKQDGYVIRFNASHPIFSGHFPERPIVPGVCIVQIAEELAVRTFGHPIRFMAIHNLKFRQPITPDQYVTISIVKVEESICNVQCILPAYDATEGATLIVSFNAQFAML